MSAVLFRMLPSMTMIRNGRHSPALCAALAVVLLLGFALVNPAQARYAALVVDADTGMVLFSRNADDHNYPASLTKIMTLYLAFDALEKGKISLDQKLRVSRRAAGQAPSKLGLKPGSTITVENAILALVTKSANDVATVVAEALGGTESKFARMMTKRARALGMKDTTFRNASGLPNRAQQSTARDMVTLALAIQRDFPEYYDYFSTPKFKYRGRVYRNHNNLLGRYEGTDGIKTGYIRASGFNLVASVHRDGRHLIGVVFGGRTAASRDAHMRSILDKSFVRVAKLRPFPRPMAQKPEPPRHLAALPPIPQAQPPLPPQIASAGEPELTLVAGKPLAAAAGGGLLRAVLGGADAQPDSRPDSQPDSQIDPRPALPLAADAARDGLIPAAATPAAVEVAALPATAAPAGAKDMARLTATKPAPARPRDVLAVDATAAGAAWAAQVGAFRHYASARERLRRSIGLLPDRFKLNGTAIEPTDESGERLFRARLIGLSEADARHACQVLKRKQVGCLAVGPEQLAGATHSNEG